MLSQAFHLVNNFFVFFTSFFDKLSMYALFVKVLTLYHENAIIIS